MCDDWIPETLVFAAGGSRHLLTLGFLVELDDRKMLDRVNCICACSTGAIIGLLLACGYTVREIVTFFAEMDFAKSITNFDVRTLISGVSLEYDDDFSSSIKNLVLAKFGYIPTLHELYSATGVSLEIVVLDYKNKNALVLTKDSEGDLSCVDAILYTCTLPGMFHKHFYKGIEMAEGSLASSYPISFTNQQKKILGFFLSEINTNGQPNFVSYFNDIVALLMFSNYRKELRDSSFQGHQTIHLCFEAINTPEDKANALLKGVSRAKNWLEHV